MQTALESIGYFISAPGGAPHPSKIGKNKILFELITEGAVYGPDQLTLHGVGTVFVHREGEETINRAEGDGYYACMTASFYADQVPCPVNWLRCFLWDDVQGVLRFSEEMLYSFHHADMDRAVIGDLAWSQFQYRLDHFRSNLSEQGIPPRLAAVLGYIEQHYQQDLSIDHLADRIGLSASHLHSEFRQHLGMTPHQHLIHQRMQVARHTLATSSDPIKAVAASVGYANTENFCRAFKKLTGFTAAAYRNKYRTYGK